MVSKLLLEYGYLYNYIYFFQSRMPGRWKTIHFYRAGVLFETLFTFFKTILPKKIISRVSKYFRLKTGSERTGSKVL